MNMRSSITISMFHRICGGLNTFYTFFIEIKREKVKLEVLHTFEPDLYCLEMNYFRLM